jgi:hypothetical protein
MTEWTFSSLLTFPAIQISKAIPAARESKRTTADPGSRKIAQPNERKDTL